MSIQFGCSNCGKGLKVPDGSSGRKVKCPQCETVNVIPDAGASSQSAPLPPPTAAQPPAGPPNAPPPVSAAPVIATSSQETSNPFQAPSSESYAQPHTLGQLTHHKVEMGDVLTQAWRRYKKQLGYGALFAIIAIGVQIPFMILSGVIQGVAPLAGVGAIVVVGIIASQVIQQAGGAYVQIVGKRFGLGVARGQTEVLSGIFSFTGFGKILALFLLFLVIILLVGLIAAAPMLVTTLLDDTGGLTPIGGGISVVLGVILLPVFVTFIIRYFLCLFFIIDRNATLSEGLKQSSKFMQGNKLTAFVTFLAVSFLGTFAMLLTCGIGFFFFMPYFESVQAVLYLKATGQYQDIAAE